MTSGEERTAYTETVRMNDYVGPGRFASVTWEDLCEGGKSHTLALVSHACIRCGAQPRTIAYQKKENR